MKYFKNVLWLLIISLTILFGWQNYVKAEDEDGYDLVAESLTITPPSPRLGQNCFIQVKVKNNSSYNLYTLTGMNFLRNFPDFSISQASSTTPSLNNVIYSGDYLYWGYEGQFTVNGEKQLSFTIDPDDALGESDLANNTISKTINVYYASDTDLAIDSIDFSVDEIIVGQPLDITIGVKNTGQTSLTDASGLAQSSFGFDLPNFEYGISDLTADPYPTLVAPFNPSDIFHYLLHGVFIKPGDFNLVFTINKDKRLVEYNSANNATTTLARVHNSLAEVENFSILSKSVSLVSSSSAIIKWRTDLATTGFLNYSQAHSSVNDNKIDVSESATEHKVTLNDLQPGGNYIFMITARNGSAEKIDMLNNFSMPADDSLRISSGPNVSVSGKNASFSWTTNLTASDKVYYKKQGTTETNAAGADTLTAEHLVEIKNLAVGRYDYFLSSTSTPGTNVKTAGASFEIKEAEASSSADSTTANDSPTETTNNVSFSATNNNLYEKLKGRIILRVEKHGEAYYISPKEKKFYYLGRPADAFQVIRGQGVGITNGDLSKLPLSVSILSGIDTDADGLPDAFEEAVGTDKTKADSDSDGFSDKDELAGDFSPLVKDQRLFYSQSFANEQKGKIFLQVQSHGEAWYINPADGRRNFLARPADAFNIMRKLGVGIGEKDYAALGGK